MGVNVPQSGEERGGVRREVEVARVGGGGGSGQPWSALIVLGLGLAASVLSAYSPGSAEVTLGRVPLLVGGAGLSMLLAGIVFAQGQSLRRARLMAEAATRDLRRLAVVAERTTNAVIITDREHRIEWVNEGFTRLTGYALEEVRGRAPGDVLRSGEGDGKVLGALRAALDDGRGFRGEVLNRSKAGRQYWVDTDIQPLRDGRGELAGFMAVESDITALVEQRRAVAASEARFRSMVEGADVIVWEYDIEGDVFTYVSPRALTLGYTIDQWKRPGFWKEHLHPEDRDEALAFCATQVAYGRPHRFAYRFQTADGREAWIDDFVSAPEVVGGRKLLRGVMVDTTQRMLSEKQIAELKERLEAAVEGTSDGLWDWRLDEGREWFSPRVWAMLGYEAESAPLGTRETFRGHVDPEDLSRFDRALDRHMGASEPLDVALRMRLVGGEPRWFRLRGDSRRDEQGRVVRVSGSLQDVDEKHRADEALRVAQERWDFAITGSGDGVWDWEIATGRAAYSMRWKQMLGYEEHEVGASIQEWSSRVHPEDLYAAMREMRAHFEGRTTLYRHEHRLRCKDGSWKWTLDRGMVVRRDAEGNPLRMVGTQTDITHAKRLEEAAAASAFELARSNEALEEAQSVARLGNWSYDIQAGRVFWSRQVYRLFGCDPALPPPDYQGVLGMYEAEDARRLDHAVAEAVAGGDSYSLVLRTREGAPGVRFVRGEGRARKDEQGRIIGLFGTVMDVTSEVERERELLDARAQAEAASRAKSEFLANMSHEIRTPMTAILGYAELLESEGGGDPGERLGHIETIKRNGQHLLSIINDILDLSKIEAGRLEVERIEICPIQVARDVASLMRVKAEAKGLELRFEGRGHVPTRVRSDPLRLRQILVNLVGNAIKFTEVGGVTVRLGMDERSASAVRIDVIDTGIGIAPDAAERLFRPFAQADSSTTRQFGGTGLGLQISKRLAQMLGGDIGLTTSLGRGSCFSFTFDARPLAGVEMRELDGRSLEDARQGDGRAGGPLQARTDLVTERAASETPKVSQESAERQPEPLAGVRVLIAEDGPDNQRLIAYQLKKLGVEVEVSANGRLAIQALERAEASGRAFDAVLMDMQMPEMDGYEATRSLRASGRRLPVIALTAHAMAGDREKCLAAGCDEYLTKPIDRDALWSSLQRLLGARAHACLKAA